MTGVKLCMILGSTRVNRANGAVARWCLRNLNQLNTSTKVKDISVLDPRDTENGFFMRMMDKAYFHYKDGEEIPPELARTAAEIESADAYLIVCPEYNHTAPPALTNFMSYFGANAYKAKPSGVITYSAGFWGGTRAGVATRPFLSELGCLPVSAQAHLPRVWTLIKDGEVKGVDKMFERNASNVVDQLLWHGNSK